MAKNQNIKRVPKKRMKFNGKFYTLAYKSMDKSYVKKIAKGLKKKGYNVRIISMWQSGMFKNKWGRYNYTKQWIAYKRKNKRRKKKEHKVAPIIKAIFNLGKNK